LFFQVLNDEVFAILVLMALFTTFITTPLVTAIYKPARKAVPYKHRKIQREKPEDELRILACLHGTRNIPAMINLIEASRGIRKPALRLYIMHLVELSERSSAIMMVHKARKNGLPFWNRNRCQQDQIVVAFEAYGQLSKVTVRPMTAISPIQDMHEDICNIADQKRIAMIILPFHKYQRVDGVLESVSLGFGTVNQRVLKHAPCSVGILVDRGQLGGQSQLAPSNVDHHVAVLFFGGPDDREALVFGRRMAEHPGIKLTVIRFLPGTEFEHTAINLTPLPAHEDETHPQVYKFSTAEMNREQEKGLDEEALQVINNKVSNPGKSPGRMVWVIMRASRSCMKSGRSVTRWSRCWQSRRATNITCFWWGGVVSRPPGCRLGGSDCRVSGIGSNWGSARLFHRSNQRISIGDSATRCHS
jgi:hypothetical protein